MSKTYSAALIGCGRMGATIDDEVRNHPNSYLWLPYSHAAGYRAVDRTRLVAVSDVDPEKVERIKTSYEAQAGYTDYREMIEKERPDIVSIATRPATHAEIALFAAEHGVKGIYCEKPLCCSMEEADAILRACEKHGVKFNYGTQRRYMPLYRKMREMAHNGDLGKVDCIIGHCGVGSALWGHTHTTDMLLFLAGDADVEWVQGSINAKPEDWEGERLNTDPGFTSAYFRFANGIHAYIVAGGGFEFEVSGNGGKTRTLNNGDVAQWRKMTEPWHTLKETPFPEVAHESGTINGIRDIVAALDTGRDTAGNIRLACKSQEMIFAVIESHRRGGAGIRLPLENRDLYVGRKDW
ncbi:MAG: Gfo/Idh/MocA family oxidoreductase [candidate division Zixibacteria bacterium]|nr:Gfo/Idh/MocA family oxidoreductase [candidate division Zixibacteria bacterium]